MTRLQCWKRLIRFNDSHNKRRKKLNVSSTMKLPTAREAFMRSSWEEKAYHTRKQAQRTDCQRTRACEIRKIDYFFFGGSTWPTDHIVNSREETWWRHDLTDELPCHCWMSSTLCTAELPMIVPLTVPQKSITSPNNTQLQEVILLFSVCI